MIFGRCFVKSKSKLLVLKPPLKSHENSPEIPSKKNKCKSYEIPPKIHEIPVIQQCAIEAMTQSKKRDFSHEQHGGSFQFVFCMFTRG